MNDYIQGAFIVALIGVVFYLIGIRELKKEEKRKNPYISDKYKHLGITKEDISFYQHYFNKLISIEEILVANSPKISSKSQDKANKIINSAVAEGLSKKVLESVLNSWFWADTMYKDFHKEEWVRLVVTSDGGGGYSKEDLKSVYDKTSDASLALFDGYFAVSSPAYIYDTETKITNDIKLATEDFDTYVAAHNLLAEDPAVEHSDIKPFFKAYKTKADAFIAFGETFIPDYGAFALAYSGCSGVIDSSRLTPPSDTLYNNCVALLTVLDPASTDIQSALAIILSQLEVRQTAAKNLAKTDILESKWDGYNDAYRDADDAIIDATTNLNSNLDVVFSDIDPTAAMKELRDALSDLYLSEL